MNKLLLATNNKHKVEEISHLLADLQWDILSLREVPNAPVTDEDQPTIEGNALKKAREAFRSTGILSLADDTGLECYFLELNPGVVSARYAGEKASYADNNKKLLRALKGVPPRHRNARFRTVVAIVGKNIEKIFEGRVEGRILEVPRGTNGFGYDPLFVPRGYDRSYAEMTINEKNNLSHRAEALRKAKEFLKTM
ncbi:MAG: RdgB/HAM1 family non-canonical purine NTP pyrophosphatase [Bacteroidota bacterium]